jgi:hypothetical protein
MPRPFGQRLEGHSVQHTSDLGWENLDNGDLLTAARAGGFEVMITVDKHMRDQQGELPIPVIFVSVFRNSEKRLVPHLQAILSLLGQRLQNRAYVLATGSR